MSKNPFGSQLFILSSLLSQQVSEKDKFFKETALMEMDQRVAYAILYVVKEKDLLNKNLSRMSIDELLEDVLMPLIQRIGQARFRADTLTHLGMKVGKPTVTREL